MRSGFGSTVCRCLFLSLETAFALAQAQDPPPRWLPESDPSLRPGGSIPSLPARQRKGGRSREPIITTFAGTDWIFQGDGAPALSAPLSQVDQLAFDTSGRLLIADPGNHMIARLDPDGSLSVLAGNGIPGFSGNGGQARDASLFLPEAAVMDGAGNLFIADWGNNVIRRVTPAGIISNYAGNGKRGFSGDGGPATSATLNQPSGLALDRAGNLYVADFGNARIRKIARDGSISTYAGNGQAVFSGDGGPATQAGMRPHRGLAVDADGSLYFSDFGNNRIRKIAPDGRISVYAGAGGVLSSGDGGPAAQADIGAPLGLALDADGNLYVAEFANFRVRRIARNGVITTVAGGSAPGFAGDGGPAVEARLSGPVGVGVDASGAIYIADAGNGRIRRVDRAGRIATVAGSGGYRNAADGTPASTAFLSDPEGIAFDGNGNLLVSDAGNYRLRVIDRGGAFRTVAGSGLRGCCLAGPALDDILGYPSGIVADGRGDIFFSDTLSYRVRRLSADGTISTYAGNGSPGFSGDGGQATQARLAAPYGLALDRDGNLYIADTQNHRVRRVAPDGTITTFAGDGQPRFAGDGGAAVDASLRSPNSMLVDREGNVLIADLDNNRIRSVSPGGVISTLAGSGKAESSGDGGSAIEAGLHGPADMAMDAAGNLFVAELFGNRVRRIGTDGTISTVAGNGRAGYSGDGGPATDASLNQPVDIALDGRGNLFIADAGNNRIRVVPAAAPAFDPASPPLRFAASSGGALPPAQRLTLGASTTGVGFSVSATSEQGDWLQASPLEGATPRLLEVTADPAGLVPGIYRGRVRILMVDALPPVREIPVEFTVSPAVAPQLSIDKPSLSFPIPLGAGAGSQTFTVSNTGSGAFPFEASASVSSGAGWLSVSPASGLVTPKSPALLTVTANPAGLAPGAYSGKVTVSDGSGESQTVLVKLLVSALDRAVLLSQTGLTFTAVAGGGAPPPQSFAVLNTGRGLVNWRASTSTLGRGRGWLSVSTAQGGSDAASGLVPGVEVRVNAAGLDPGGYYGQIRIDAPGAANTPQSVTVFLEVLPPGGNPGPAVEPSELIFNGVAGEASPGSKEIQLYNLTGAEITYRSKSITENGGDWLVYLPRDARVRPERPNRIVVQPVTGSLQPGVYRGSLALQFSDGNVRNVSLVYIVSPASASTAGARAEEVCTPSTLVPALSSLGQAFSVSAGWPVALVAEVRDDCGAPVDSGEVVATFTNGDPPQRFTSLKNGIWHGTWRTGASSLSDVTIRLQAVDRRNLRGVREVRGGLRSLQELPVISAGAVVSAASFEPYVPLAPGARVSISGDRLAEVQIEASTVPLPTDLAGTEVLIAGQLMPLVSVSEKRIEAIVPYGVEVNTTHQILVQRGVTLSQPAPVDMAAAQPAIFFAASSAQTQGRIFVLRAEAGQQLAAAAAPAKPGDNIVILCAGVGAVDAAQDAASPGPEAPRAAARQSVRVTIGGAEAPVSFAGLAPGLLGVYQVEASVPEAASRGAAIPVILQVAGQTSPPATMAIE